MFNKLTQCEMVFAAPILTLVNEMVIRFDRARETRTFYPDIKLWTVKFGIENLNN